MEFINMSDGEIVWIEKVEDTLFSMERKVYNFKIMRLEESGTIYEAGISLEETCLKDDRQLSLEKFDN